MFLIPVTQKFIPESVDRTTTNLSIIKTNTFIICKNFEGKTPYAINVPLAYVKNKINWRKEKLSESALIWSLLMFAPSVLGIGFPKPKYSDELHYCF